MDIVKSELEAVAKVVEGEEQNSLQQLNDLQLMLVGGGSGEILFG